MSDEELRAQLARAELDLERARAAVVRSVRGMRDEVIATADWRTWVRRRPGAFVAAAFVAGLIAGARN